MEIEINLRKIINTLSLQEQKIESFTPVERWWHEKLCTGNLHQSQWPEKVMYIGLHEDYVLFTDKHYRAQRSRKATESELGKFLNTYAPGEKQRELVEGKREMFRSMPSLDECRKYWLDLVGVDTT